MAHAAVSGERIHIAGLYVDGSETMYTANAEGPADQGEALARRLARELKEGRP